jgi:hypothetical protein
MDISKAKKVKLIPSHNFCHAILSGVSEKSFAVKNYYLPIRFEFENFSGSLRVFPALNDFKAKCFLH